MALSATEMSDDSDTLPVPRSGVTVLVVDDDRANLDSVCRIFQREGVATLAASNGQEAVELLRRPEVGVVVTDLMMPGLDGQGLLKAARAMRPDVEVVLMTAYATVETAVNSMRDGAYDFITKPLKRHSLVKAVQKAMEKQALLAENRDLKAQLAALGPRTLGGQAPAFRAFLDTLTQAADGSRLAGTLWLNSEQADRAVELRRLFPGITDNVQARTIATNIAGWKPRDPLPRSALGRKRRRTRPAAPSS